MRNLTYLYAFLFILPALYLLQRAANEINTFPTERERKSGPVESIVQTPPKGADCEIFNFETWHHPEPHIIPFNWLQDIWAEVLALPSEDDGDALLPAGWQCIGPYGQELSNHSGSYYTGRVLDLALNSSDIGFVAAASGGLWDLTGIYSMPISDQLNSLAIGSFCVQPGNDSYIVLGTGEYRVRTGVGCYWTSDGGTNWQRSNLNPDPGYYNKIRFHLQSENIVHAATEQGYYRSDDNGQNFQRYLNGNISDFAQAPDNPQVIMAGVIHDGFYVSNDAGLTWNQITPPYPHSDSLGRISITAYNTNIFYTAIVKYSNSQMLGIYKTTDRGANWQDISLSSNYFGKQGWYNNVITVCPVDSNIVLAGGVSLHRTSDGGATWTSIGGHGIHADHHRFAWDEYGNNLWSGNDGGIALSTDKGLTWSNAMNRLPITQYVNIAVGKSNPLIMTGGSQDNGLSVTTNAGGHWYHTHGGDAGGSAILPDNASYVYGSLGVFDAPWAFQRVRSTDYGMTWAGINNGIDSSGHWYHKIRTDDLAPIYIYNNSGEHVYRSIDYGDNWEKVDTNAFPTNSTLDLAVSHYTPPSSILYSSLRHTASNNHDGFQLRVYDGGIWQERSNTFPDFAWVKTVVPHPFDEDIAYALMSGLFPGEKIYKTVNRGIDWVNISGNLPNVVMGSCVPHPTEDQIIYLGTEMGCYRTEDFGSSWIRWNKGMPIANMITEMTYIDSAAINGSFYIVAGSYGRSMWMRDISDVDPLAVDELPLIPETVELYQNYPNPFNPVTKIQFSIAKASAVTIQIFDVKGALMETLLDRRLPAGTNTIPFNAANYASGIYFYRLTVPGKTLTKKMILLK